MLAFVPLGWITALRNPVSKHSWPTSKETWTLWSANFNVVQPQTPQCLCTETKENSTGLKTGKQSNSNIHIVTLQITVILSFAFLKTLTSARSWAPASNFSNLKSFCLHWNLQLGGMAHELSPYSKLWHKAKAGTSAAIMNSLLAEFSCTEVPSNCSASPPLWFGW